MDIFQVHNWAFRSVIDEDIDATFFKIVFTL